MNLAELKAAAEELERDGDTITLPPATILKLIAVVEATAYSGVAKDCQMIADALKELEK
jgi:hypothetical protein